MWNVYFCFSSLFLAFTRLTSLSSLLFSSSLFASHSLPHCCPRRLFCWHNRRKFKLGVSQTHKKSEHGNRGVELVKSRMCLWDYLDNTVQNSKLLFNFCCFLLFVCSVQRFEKAFCFFVIQMKLLHTNKTSAAFLLTHWGFLALTNPFCV